MEEPRILLAGDIGGTKTILAIYTPEKGPRLPLATKTFLSAGHPSLEAMAEEFLAGVGMPVDRASFGVAGPVSGGMARVTNLPWNVDEARLEEELGLGSVHLVNDLKAIAHAAPFLGSGDLQQLQPGDPDPDGALGVVAPGTGLGEAFLTREGIAYRAHPSEGGHADFAPIDELEIGLLRYLLGRFGRASYERVCSGLGMPNVYGYLKEIGHAEESSRLAEELAAAEQLTPVIVNAALADDPDPLCAAALDLFVSFPKLFLASGRVGFYLRVLEEGGVGAGDIFERVGEDPGRMTVREMSDLLFFEPGNLRGAERALRVRALSPGWRGSFEERLAKAGDA